MESSDELCSPTELTRLLQTGDIESLDRLTRCYGARLLSAARHHCRNEHEAADAVQDAMIGAWRYGKGYRGEGRVDRWLVRLVASACTRLRRGHKNDSKLHLTDHELVDDEVSPELLAARAQLAEVLGEAINELPPRDRAILILADAQGHKGPEIAAELGMSPGAVRTRLSRIHARLRDRLTPLLERP